MYKNKTFLAIIPARGGSKRLPKKNILDLDGKPLISWTIESGLNSKYIDKVIVSSDDDEILKISKKFCSDIIIRPDELASDTSTSFDVIKHIIQNNDNYDYIVLLQPTSPLRNSIHIDEAIETLFIKDASAIVSVCEMDHSPLWSNILPNDGNMNDFIREEIIDTRSQDLPTYYRLNGAIYIYEIKRLLKEKNLFFKDNSYAYKMSKDVSIDIDEKIDLDIARAIVSSTI